MQKKRNFVAQKSIGIKDMSQKEIHLKAVLFDMDGVLFNSMPNQHCLPASIGPRSHSGRNRKHLSRKK